MSEEDGVDAQTEAAIEVFLTGFHYPGGTEAGERWYEDGGKLATKHPEIFLRAMRSGSLGMQDNAQMALRRAGYQIVLLGHNAPRVYDVTPPGGDTYQITPEQQEPAYRLE